MLLGLRAFRLLSGSHPEPPQALSSDNIFVAGETEGSLENARFGDSDIFAPCWLWVGLECESFASHMTPFYFFRLLQYALHRQFGASGAWKASTSGTEALASGAQAAVTGGCCDRLRLNAVHGPAL